MRFKDIETGNAFAPHINSIVKIIDNEIACASLFESGSIEDLRSQVQLLTKIVGNIINQLPKKSQSKVLAKLGLRIDEEDK